MAIGRSKLKIKKNKTKTFFLRIDTRKSQAKNHFLWQKMWHLERTQTNKQTDIHTHTDRDRENRRTYRISFGYFFLDFFLDKRAKIKKNKKQKHKRRYQAVLDIDKTILSWFEWLSTPIHDLAKFSEISFRARQKPSTTTKYNRSFVFMLYWVKLIKQHFFFVWIEIETFGLWNINILILESFTFKEIVANIYCYGLIHLIYYFLTNLTVYVYL